MATKTDQKTPLVIKESESRGTDASALARARQFSSDTWTWEVLASTLSLISLSVIVVTLGIYDDKALPHFSSGITLNAIISILATMSKSLIALAVASAMGQLKWHWSLRPESRLHELQTFDDASRGPLGALVLAALINVRSFALLGAIITVISLATDPFAQQLLTFPTRTVFAPSREARVRLVTNLTVIPDLGSGLLFTENSFSSTIAKPLYQGLYSGPREPLTGCPSGNCTWPTFHSLSWRTQCRNITSSMTLTSCDFAFPPAVPVDANSNFCTVSTGPSDPWTTFATRKRITNDTVQITGPEYLVWPTVDFNWADSSAYAADGTVPGPANNFMSLAQVHFGYNNAEISSGTFTGPHLVSATECSLVPCVQEYSFSMSAGKLHTKVLSTTYGSLPDSSTIWSATVPPSLSSEVKTFTVAKEILSSVALGLVTLLEGNATQVILDNTSDPSTGSSTLTPQGSVYINRITYPPSLAYVLQYSDFETTMHNIASRLTFMGQSLASASDPDLVIIGEMGTVESYVHVRWGWLALPVLVVVLGIIFLVTTIARTRKEDRIPLWKGSIVPFLTGAYQQIPLDISQGTGKVESMKLSTLEHHAKHVTTRARTK